MGPDMTPTVTVLMPVWNAEEFVSGAVESILQQSFADFELLVIEDGSTDGTRGILKTFTDSRLKIFENGARRGVVASLNRGLELAQGRYIARMDADDISLFRRLEKQVAFMDANPEVGVSSGWLKTMGDRVDRIWKSPQHHDEILAAMFCDSCIWHPAAIMRREVMDRNGLTYEPEYPRSEDYRLWTRFAVVSKLANLPEVLIRYRIHPGQESKRPNTSQKIRLELLEAFLGRTPTDEEKELHGYLHFETPFTRLETLKKVRRWIEYLKSLNQTTHTYAEPVFSECLDRVFRAAKRKSFRFLIRNKKHYSPACLYYLYLTQQAYFTAFPTRRLLKLTVKSCVFWPNPSHQIREGSP